MLDLLRRKVRALFGGQNPGIELGGTENGAGSVHRRRRIHDIRYKSIQDGVRQRQKRTMNRSHNDNAIDYEDHDHDQGVSGIQFSEDISADTQDLSHLISAPQTFEQPGEVTIRCLLPQGLSLFGPVNTVQPSTRIFRSIGVQTAGICDAFSQFSGPSLSAGRFQNPTPQGQNEIDGSDSSVPYLLRTAASWTPPGSASTTSSESVTPPQSRLHSLDTPHPSDDTQSVDSIQSTQVLPADESIVVSDSVSAHLPSSPPDEPSQHTPSNLNGARVAHAVRRDSRDSVQGISPTSETTESSPPRVTPNSARSPTSVPSSSPAHSPDTTVMDASHSPQPTFKKEFRAFRNCREGHTAWYFSYGPYSLPIPPVSIRCEPGDLYLHLDQSSDTVQSWVMQTDHAWIIAEERMPHPKLPNRVLWFRSKEEPSWVTIHTLRTYDSRMRHDQLKRQLASDDLTS